MPFTFIYYINYTEGENDKQKPQTQNYIIYYFDFEFAINVVLVFFFVNT